MRVRVSVCASDFHFIPAPLAPQSLPLLLPPPPPPATVTVSSGFSGQSIKKRKRKTFSLHQKQSTDKCAVQDHLGKKEREEGRGRAEQSREGGTWGVHNTCGQAA